MKVTVYTEDGKLKAKWDDGMTTMDVVGLLEMAKALVIADNINESMKQAEAQP